jgi:diketogulonate reductase-like aldo/keto reductase
VKKFSKTIKLNTEAEMPRLGLGVWQIGNNEVEAVVETALAAGYRLVDTAKIYGNEEGVGRAIGNSKIPRKEIFVTTKLWASDILQAKHGLEMSLKRLGLEYVDLYLIHWPFPLWKKAWRDLEGVFKEGKARAIGVSNFGTGQLEALKKMGGMVPAVDQIEISPFWYRKELVDYCQAEGIQVEAYSPLTRGRRLNDQTVSEMAEKYKKSAAQILIRWGLQHDLIEIPKSTKKEHIKDNIKVFDFEIGTEEMKKLDGLNENYSTSWTGWR